MKSCRLGSTLPNRVVRVCTRPTVGSPAICSSNSDLCHLSCGRTLRPPSVIGSAAAGRSVSRDVRSAGPTGGARDVTRTRCRPTVRGSAEVDCLTQRRGLRQPWCEKSSGMPIGSSRSSAGKIKTDLRKYITHGEMIGKTGRRARLDPAAADRDPRVPLRAQEPRRRGAGAGRRRHPDRPLRRR